LPNVSLCLKVTFKGGAQHAHAPDCAVHSRPDWEIRPFDLNDARLTRMVGTSSGSSVTSIGFRSNKNTIFGPWGGGGGGQNFSVDGEVLGFFGALRSGSISGMGVWYTPTVTASFPASRELPSVYQTLSEMWTWEDVPESGGAHQLFQRFLYPSLGDQGHFSQYTIATYDYHQYGYTVISAIVTLTYDNNCPSS
jgi:hypothetical protein